MLCLIHFVLHDLGRTDLPDSRRVFDLGATHRQIMNHLVVDLCRLFRLRTDLPTSLLYNVLQLGLDVKSV